MTQKENKTVVNAIKIHINENLKTFNLNTIEKYIHLR